MNCFLPSAMVMSSMTSGFSYLLTPLLSGLYSDIFPSSQPWLLLSEAMVQTSSGSGVPRNHLLIVPHPVYSCPLLTYIPSVSWLTSE